MVVQDNLDRRVLGALRLVDAPSGLPISDPLQLQAPGVAFWRNRRNLYVIASAPGLDAHINAFTAPPAAPALGSIAVTVTISDPSGRYLARQVTIQLPRDPDPAHDSQPTSLFQPVTATLYPTPMAPVEPGWALVRGTVTRSGTSQGIGGALLRVLRASDNQVLARGLSDSRGEALVAVPGIPITTWDSGSEQVFATEIGATLEVYSAPVPPSIPDPDALEAARSTLISTTTAINLARGQTVVVPLALSLP